MKVNAWGACEPIDCDWGETNIDLWNGRPVAEWNHGFATERVRGSPAVVGHEEV
jgi:hypothetical protein